MVAKIWQKAQAWQISLVVTVLAVVSFNNWFLSVFLNRNLFTHRAAVSELSAMGQPHQAVFRSLDVVSGVLFVLLAVLLLNKMARKARSRYYVVFFAAALGIANVFDALFPLNCSPTVSQACETPVNISLTHFTIPSHGYSSIVIGVCYLLLPLAGLFYALRIKAAGFITISAITTAVAVISGGAAIVEYLVTHGFSERAWGPSQEIQMLILGAWFVGWYMAVNRGAKAPAKKPKLKTVRQAN